MTWFIVKVFIIRSLVILHLPGKSQDNIKAHIRKEKKKGRGSVTTKTVNYGTNAVIKTVRGMALGLDTGKTDS